MSAPTSRLAKCMRGRLGASQWSDFVRHANENYKSGFVRAFEQPTLRCVGTLDGAPCPHAFAVDLAAPDAKGQLAHLHLDHEQPVHLTCAAWAQALPAEPRAWDEGVDRAELCRALFDVGGGACRFRCGPKSDAAGRRERFAQRVYCHRA